MGLINLSRDSEYEERIDDLKETIAEFEEEVEYWRDVHERDYKKIQEMEDKMETLKTLMENLPPYQLPVCELDKYEYGALVFDSDINRLIFPEEQPFEMGDYLLIKSNDLNKSVLARISDVSCPTRGYITSSLCKDFGFTNQDVFRHYLNLRYPDAVEQDKFYVYKLIIFK